MGLRTLAALGLALAALLGTSADRVKPESALAGSPTNAPEFVNQHAAHRMACGPASLLNALLAGDAAQRRAFDQLPGDSAAGRLQGLLATYGERPSAEEPAARRFDARSGVGPFDLLAWSNDVRADSDLPAVAGAFLDRGESASPEQHLRDTHALLYGSLKAGTPPVVRLRLFAASGSERGQAPTWEAGAAHWITVVDVPEKLRPFDAGFELVCIDPSTGAHATVYVRSERERPFVAAKGAASTWTWLSGQPFLLVEAPTLEALGRAGLPWHRRAIVTLDYSIHAPR